MIVRIEVTLEERDVDGATTTASCADPCEAAEPLRLGAGQDRPVLRRLGELLIRWLERQLPA